MPSIGQLGIGLNKRRGGGGGPLAVPAGFGWTPPVSIFRSPEGDYSTDYDTSPFLSEGAPGVTTIYVDGQAGNDANPGTAALPKRSIVSVSAGRVAKLLIKARGTFYQGTNGAVQTGHDEMCVEAWGGADLVFTTLAEPGAISELIWTDEGSGVWSAPSSFALFNGISVYFGTNFETAVKYPVAASLAACQAAPGTIFRETSPIKHYVHTLDGTSPGTGHLVFGKNGSSQQFFSHSRSFDQRVAFHGALFLGGDDAFRFLGTPDYTKRLDFVNCQFARAGTFGALQCRQSGTVVSHGCIFGPSDFDGASYHALTSAPGGTVTNAVEIGCIGRDNGLGVGANQGSTTHFGGKVVRVNCNYRNNENDQSADVGESTSAWILGCEFGPRRSGNTVNSGYQLGNNADTCAAWLDGTTFEDVEFDVGVASGGTIYYRNMPAPSIATGSTGTVTTY